MQVTHDVDRATEMGRAFGRQNSLNGSYPTVPGYKTSKTRVCVTVAMMTTGYDCPDLLNLGFCRLVKSPTDYTTDERARYAQVRVYREFHRPIGKRPDRTPRPKEQFCIIDYFGVCEYFGEGDLYSDETASAIP